MSPTVRGQPTGLTWVPPAWRGPLPDVSVRRHLPVRDGYVRVPLDLLFSTVPDLAVVVWAALKLGHDERPAEISYQDLAQQFGLQDLTPRAVQGRFTAATKALVDSGWLSRRRGANNTYTYLAVTPKKISERYAMLRRCDLALLRAKPMRGAEPVGPTQLGDFCRWQLECGQRGWTGEQLTTMAQRWNLSERQFRNRRARLMACKLNLIVSTPRTGYPDVVWLGELHDPHWQVPSDPQFVEPVQSHLTLDQPVDGAVGTSATFGVSEALPVSGTPATFGVSPRQRTVSRPRQLLVSPYKEELTDSLPVDLSGLGGASATPLTSVTRELGEAVPQAAPSRNISQGESAAHRVACLLLGGQPYLALAPPHFRAAMLKRLTRAVRAGLDARHVARALERVVGHADRDSHCELVRLAVQQAWADQRGGLCPECAGDGSDSASHDFSCSVRPASAVVEDPETIKAAIVASLETVRAARGAADVVLTPGSQPKVEVVDPLKPFLESEPEPYEVRVDWAEASDDELLGWLTAAIARSVAHVPPVERLGAVQRVWASWRPKVPPARRDVLDLAAMRLRQLVDQPAQRPLQEARVS